VGQAVAIIEELRNFAPSLLERERWLVFNKCDLLFDEEQATVREGVVSALGFEGRVFTISAAERIGTQALCYELMNFLEARAERMKSDDAYTESQQQLDKQIEQEVKERIKQLSEARKAKSDAERSRQKQEEAEDVDAVEVVYQL